MSGPSTPRLHYVEATYVMPDRWVTMNDRLHPRQQGKIKNRWIEACKMFGYDMWRKHGKPPEDQRVEVQIVFGTRRPNQRRDPANWMLCTKWVLDGLVAGGLFTDDDSKHVIQLEPGFTDRIPPTHFLIRLEWSTPA